MTKKQLIYFVYGDNLDYTIDPIFSILSALYCAKKDKDFKIVVYTTRPKDFEVFPVETISISKQTLEDWFGPHGYIHRSKNRVIAKALPQAEKTIFIDTDTYFLKSPSLLFERVAPGNLLIDYIQDPWHACPFKKLPVAQYLEEKQMVEDNTPSVNSGLIGLTKSDADFVERTVQLMDELYLMCNKRFDVEQFALSIAAHQNKKLVLNKGVVKHYCKRKEVYRGRIRAYYHKHKSDFFSKQALLDIPKVKAYMLKPARPYRWIYRAMVALAPNKTVRQFYIELLYGRHTYINEFDNAGKRSWWTHAIKNYCDRKLDHKETLPAVIENKMTRFLLGKDYKDFLQYLKKHPSFNDSARSSLPLTGGDKSLQIK